MSQFTEEYITRIASGYPTDPNVLRRALAEAQMAIYTLHKQFEEGIALGNRERKDLQDRLDAVNVDLRGTNRVIREDTARLQIYKDALERIRDGGLAQRKMVSIAAETLEWKYQD